MLISHALFQIMDHEVLSKEDLCSQYLAPHDSIGVNRAQSSLMRLQRLNPMVEVAADMSNLADASKDFFDGKFDIVIVTHCTSKDVLLAVNKVLFRRKINRQKENSGDQNTRLVEHSGHKDHLCNGIGVLFIE